MLLAARRCLSCVAVVLALVDVARAEPVSSDPLRLGILGSSGLSNMALNLEDPSELEGVIEVVAVASRDLSKARMVAGAIGSGVKAASSYDELLADPTVEAVYLPLVNGVHYEWAMKALAAGKHVLCEKPLASNAEEARRLVAFAEEQQLVLMEAMHSFRHPLFGRARSLLGSGIVGKVKHVEARFSIREGAFDRATSTRYKSELSGGATLDLGGYVLGCLVTLMGGEVPEVTKATASTWATDEDIDEAMRGKVRFLTSGVLGSFSWSFVGQKDERRFVVNGTVGKLIGTEFVHPYRGGSLHAEAHVGGGELMQREEFGHPSTYTLQMRVFVAAVQKMRADEADRVSGEQPLTTGLAIVGLASLLDAVYVKAGMSPRTGPAGIKSVPPAATSASPPPIVLAPEPTAADANAPRSAWPDCSTVRCLGDRGLSTLTSSTGAAFLMLSQPGCKMCANLRPAWTMVAQQMPGRAYAAQCSELPGVCTWPADRYPMFLIWDGTALEPYAGPQDLPSLIGDLQRATERANTAHRSRKPPHAAKRRVEHQKQQECLLAHAGSKVMHSFDTMPTAAAMAATGGEVPSHRPLILQLSDAEQTCGVPLPSTLRLAAMLLHSAGYVVLRGAMPNGTVSSLRESLQWAVDTSLRITKEGRAPEGTARGVSINECDHEDAVCYSGWHQGNRYKLAPSLSGVFAQDVLLRNSFVLPVIEKAFGTSARLQALKDTLASSNQP